MGRGRPRTGPHHHHHYAHALSRHQCTEWHIVLSAHPPPFHGPPAHTAHAARRRLASTRWGTWVTHCAAPPCVALHVGRAHRTSSPARRVSSSASWRTWRSPTLGRSARCGGGMGLGGGVARDMTGGVLHPGLWQRRRAFVGGGGACMCERRQQHWVGLTVSGGSAGRSELDAMPRPQAWCVGGVHTILPRGPVMQPHACCCCCAQPPEVHAPPSKQSHACVCAFKGIHTASLCCWRTAPPMHPLRLSGSEASARPPPCMRTLPR